MNVIYLTCYQDPWLKVAQKLKEEHGFEPVYWVGYEDDDSKNLVPKFFPKCIYQDYYDAWKGVFPEKVTEKFSTSYIDIDFLKEYASFELQAIKMMDRMDSDRYSFNFMERQRHYRNMIKFCSACITFFKADVIICDLVPHRVFDYVMYLLCRFYNIKFVCLGNTQFIGRKIRITDILSISNQIKIDYEKIYKSSQNVEKLKSELPIDIMNGYYRILKDYSTAQPEIEKRLLTMHKQTDNFSGLLFKFISDFSGRYKSRYLGKKGFLLNGFPTYLKQRNKIIEKSKTSLFLYSLQKIKNNRYKNRLKKHYNMLCVEPDYTANYVYFGLHYQPEMTTSPSGDIFVDQRLCIEVLLKQLTSDCLIYVKEHPAQFYSHIEGHTSRAKYFYSDLLSNPRVKFVSIDTDPFRLVKNAKAVATIVGTVGWEAMVLGKPVIAFGLIWYENFEGVLKVSNENTASKISKFIDEFKYDEKKLFAYLTAFSLNSSIVYSDRGAKELLDVSECQNIERLINFIQPKDFPTSTI